MLRVCRAAAYCSDSVATENEIAPVTDTRTTSAAPVFTETSVEEAPDTDNETSDQSDDCDSSYPDFCIPSSAPNLNCPDISGKRFTVQGSDPHEFDRDNYGVGCES
jgi:hypothetical protein